MNEDVTPIRQQYLEIKQNYPDTILFFRLGDFYETFDQDAETTSRELDIVLTSRNVAKGVRIPMAGIPYHAVENYLARLIEKGYHVAICEQVGEQPTRGLFPRQVVRVVTPGTVVEPTLLKGDSNNYLACVVVQDSTAGIAYVDITTGEFAVTELNGEDILNLARSELLRLQPAEILLPDSLKSSNSFPGHHTYWTAWKFEPGRCEQALKEIWGVASLDGYGLRGKTLAVRAAGGIAQYLREMQPEALKLLAGISTYQLADFMVLDGNTRRNLELIETIRDASVQGSLLGILDCTMTPMGHRLIRQWVGKPLLDLKRIAERHAAVGYFFDHGLERAELRSVLKSIADIERLANRVISGYAQPRDLVGLRSSLRFIPRLVEKIPPDFQTQILGGQQIDPCVEIAELLEAALPDDPPATLQNVGVIRPGYSAELDNIVAASQDARQWIGNLESVERDRTGIRSLKVGYNKVFGYYIEVTHSNTQMIPPEYIRKQTLVNAERYITPEMKEYESLVLNAEERMKEVENTLFKDVCARISAGSGRLLATSRSLAWLDVIMSLAETAALGGYILPEMVDEPVLKIVGGRHPVVEQTLTSERFVPNDIIFEEGELIRIITGPNMSGKSTYLRQSALIVLMAQMGSFVPAESATIGIVDRIFTRIGAQDEIHAGQSTFMVEMIETANILHHASQRSLLILDEIGRGTSTYDGLSIAWAVVEYIHNHPHQRARTLFATHYHELTQLSELLPGVRNYNVAVSEADGKVIFLHKIIPGGADRSYGIHVAQLAGLPRPVIQRAGEILQQLELSSGKTVQINPIASQQIALFPETNPLLEELANIDINVLSPIEALNKIFEWKSRFSEDKSKN